MIAVELGGWAAAAAAGLLAVGVRRSLTGRAEAVASACHELRGSLTAARLGLELSARPGQLSPARMRAIELELERAALALDDLLLLGGRFAGPVQPRRAEVDVQRLLRDAVEAQRPTAIASGVDLQLSWSGPSARLLAERVRLAQAIDNLIVNAIEHGAARAIGRGGGVVRVRGAGGGGAGGDSRVRIEVSDDGPGLGAPLAELLRPRRGRARGRGLAIAAAVIAAHHGRLLAERTSGGARLVIELPAA
jgi:signal transduction histidine kinase